MITNTRPHFKRGIIAWCIYDWAISPFSSVITMFIFATYFTQAVAKNKIVGTAEWGMAIAIASFIIAVCSPIFGAIADKQGRRKPWLIVFTWLMIISTALLWFTKPAENYVHWALTFVVLGTVGLEISTVFYNSMMRDLVPENYFGRISGWAWGLGYAGGITCLSIALFGFVQGHISWLHLNHAQAEQIRIVGPLVAVWLAFFSLPLFIFTPDRPSHHIGTLAAIRGGFTNLFNTFRHLSHYKNIVKFLIAQMIYIDGLNTLFIFGGIYAAGTFGMSFEQVMKFGIAMNIAAGLGAISFAWIDDWIGAKHTIFIALLAMASSGTVLLFIHSQLLFWIFALFLSLFVGPVQAASRSLMSHLVPDSLATEMFGMYAFSGKATSFFGPWLVGLITLLFASQRVGMGVVMVFLFVGALLLLRVQVTKEQD